MPIEHNVPLRAARDRLIDVLGIGDTCPLPDLCVRSEPPKVAYGGTANILIDDAQIGVKYRLCDKDGKPVGDAEYQNGSGEVLTIQTPIVNADVTYRVQAAKLRSAQAPRFLDQSATVTVGIDTTLSIHIRNRPWIVAYNGSVNVQIDKTQEGVQYSLVLDGKDLSGSVTGNLGSVELPTGPRQEDTLIQVRATKIESVLLDAKLTLGVMANPAATVVADAAGVIDYRQNATIRIAATQASAKYLAYICLVPDEDFVRDAPDDPRCVPVAGKLDLQVKKPGPVLEGRIPADWQPIAKAESGGKDVVLQSVGLTEDAIVVVRAIKEHRQNPDKPSDPVESSVWLRQAAVLRVRPDPAAQLLLRAPLVGDITGDSMQVSGGQPGVFYHFRPAPSGTEFPLPAYFHKRNAQDTQNKGIGEGGLAIGIDFVITDDPPTPPADRAAERPQPPRLSITPLPKGSSLKVRAVKAQTGIEVAASDAVIDTEPAAVPSGGSATPKPGA